MLFNFKPSWSHVAIIKAVSIPLGTVAAVFGLLVLLSYYLKLEFIYRPLVNGPATNPLTALCFFLLVYAIFTNAIGKNFLIQKLLVIVVITITGVRILDAYFDTHVYYVFTPFQHMVQLDLESGKQNAMGVNTAIKLFFATLSFFFHTLERPLIAQTLGFAALFFPTMTFVGVAYGESVFYGQMSLITATIGYTLVLGILAFTVESGLLRALLSPHIGGKFSRYQVVIGISIPVFLGYLFIKTIQVSDIQNAFGLFVITLCWLIFLLVGISAIYHEKLDHERRNMEKELIEAANVDPLTQLYNRRKFFKDGNREIKRSYRSKKFLWLMMIDIDYFKKVNDIAGHDTGDKALAAVAKAIKSSVRETDLVARIGGEEFAILLTDTDYTRDAAHRVAVSIRQIVEKIYIPGWTAKHGPLTVSIGVTSTRTASTIEQALKNADKSLYHAKNDGRNKVMG